MTTFRFASLKEARSAGGGLQEPAEKKDPRPPEGTEETLYRMRREKLSSSALDGCRIAGVLLKPVEMSEVPATSVHEKAQELLENLHYRYPFLTFPNTAEQPFEVLVNRNAAQVAHKQSQSTATAIQLLS
jgi:hypothetical protein